MRHDKLKMLCFFGTRPEAVKIVPIVLAARERRDVDVRMVSSGQHPKEMLEVLEYFGLVVDNDLRLFRKGQTLVDVHRRAMRGFALEIERWLPDVVLVQGDTTTALAGALAAYYAGVPVGHVEAGLRTRDMQNPFPEEMNRRLIDTFADYLLPPTDAAAANLAVEDLRGAEVFVTGNTVVDALRMVSRDERPFPSNGPIVDAFTHVNGYKHRVLVTVHRRESWGQGIDTVASVIRDVARARPDVQFLTPLHPNPRVRSSFERDLPANVVTGDPLPYATFVKVLSGADLVVTDSGGVTEEAASLGKHVVILRRCTERPEAVTAAGAEISGLDAGDIEATLREAVDRLGASPKTSGMDVFGDGQAGGRIVDWLRWRFGCVEAPPDPFSPTPTCGGRGSKRRRN